MSSSPTGRRRASLVKLVVAAGILGAVLVLGPFARALGPRDRHLTDARHGLSVEAPAGWTLSQHSGYGDTVAVLLHPDGGRISVTASPTTAADGRALFEQNQKGLLAQKMTATAPQQGPHGFLSVDITVPGRPDRLRQLYLVRSTPEGKQGVILTLVCRDTLFAELTSALAFVAERLELDEPVLPPPPGGPRTAGAGGAGPPLTGRAKYAAALAAPPSDRPIDLGNPQGVPEPSRDGLRSAKPSFVHADTSALGLGGGPGTTGAAGSGGQLRAGHGDRKPGP